MPTATLRFDDPRAHSLMRAVGPEAGREIPRARVEASMDGEDMMLRVEASDLSSMRAALNSYLRWIRLCKEMFELTGE
ncbi:MAG: KEOPS complex subunit Pcc1 [Methanomassiliicoccales archaeon]